MVVMLVAIVLFSIIKFDSLFLNFLVRIVLIPVVAGISYEIIRLSAKKEGGFVFKFITKPGVWLQNLTTKEPDDKQLEVAIEALKEIETLFKQLIGFTGKADDHIDTDSAMGHCCLYFFDSLTIHRRGISALHQS